MSKITYIMLSLLFVGSVVARNPAYDPTPWNVGSAEGAYVRSQPTQEEPKAPEESLLKEAKKPEPDPKPWHVGERHPYLEGDNKGCCPEGDAACKEEGREMCPSKDAPTNK